MAKRHSFARFTPLMESGNGLRPSQRESSGGRLYKGVTIIKAGLGNRRDMHFYPADSLRAAVREGKFEGIRAYADHPTSIDDQIQPERTIRDMVGLYENAKYVESGGGRVVADLRVLRAHKWLAEVIDELIEVKHADKIGISINGAGETEVREVNVDGETLEVNAVAEFQKIRSADIVTEAGAGGGFQQILESARGASRETMNERQKLVKALKEAGKTGNVKTIRECAAALEAHDAEIAGSKGKKAGKKVAEAAEDTRRKAKSRRAAAADEGDEEDEDVVAGREVDDAVDDAVREAEGDEDDDAADEGDDAAEDLDESDEDDEDGDDEDGDDDVKESDDDEEGDVNETPARRAIRRQREAAARTERTRENAMKGYGKRGIKDVKGVPRTGKGKGGSMVKPAGGSKRGANRSFGESDRETGAGVNRLELRDKLRLLRSENARLSRRNSRLGEALGVRVRAERVRKLVKESEVPAGMKGTLAEKLIAMGLDNEKDIRREIQFTERLIESSRDSVLEDFDDERVEGSPSRFRESFSGRRGGDGDDDVSDILREAGLPVKDDASDDEDGD
jgi:hypothetical protein